METALLSTLQRQILDLDRQNGSQALGEDFCGALLETIRAYTGPKDSTSLRRDLFNLYDLLLECHPRMANLIFDLQHLIVGMNAQSHAPVEELGESLAELAKRREERLEKATQCAMPLLTDQSQVLIHSYSSSLLRLLERAAMHSVKPRIIVAGQDKEKSERIVQALDKNSFDFFVVSEYSISHVLDQINLALFGGLTLNSEGALVLGPGSASLIAQLRAHDIPRYVYLPTNKFSLWQEPRETTFKEVRTKHLGEIEYNKHVFSHDTLPGEHLTGIITEKGVLTPHEAIASLVSLQHKFCDHEATIRQSK